MTVMRVIVTRCPRCRAPIRAIYGKPVTCCGVVFWGQDPDDEIRILAFTRTGIVTARSKKYGDEVSLRDWVIAHALAVRAHIPEQARVFYGCEDELDAHAQYMGAIHPDARFLSVEQLETSYDGEIKVTRLTTRWSTDRGASVLLTSGLGRIESERTEWEPHRGYGPYGFAWTP